MEIEFSKIISVTGKGGLFYLKTQRPNGVVVQSLDDGKSQFLSSRTYMFMPLVNISIFTDDGSLELEKVFTNIIAFEEKNALPEPTAPTKELREWFRKIVPDFEEDKVYDRDIKKVLRWYQSLKEKDLLKFDKEPEKEEKAAEKEEKPKAKAAKKTAKKAAPKAKKKKTKKED